MSPHSSHQLGRWLRQDGTRDERDDTSDEKGLVTDLHRHKTFLMCIQQCLFCVHSHDTTLVKNIFKNFICRYQSLSSRKQFNYINSLAIMIVFELPPRESLSSQVRTESLYGMKTFLPMPTLAACSANALMTDPSVTRDLLMCAPSFSLCPVAPVASALSLQCGEK